MARIPYPDLKNQAIAPLVDRIVAERGTVLNLYGMLLNAPDVAEGWLNFLTAIRQKSSLPGSVRELVIMRVAVINGADYEYRQHFPIALKEGLSQAQIDALPAWEGAPCFEARERAVLAYCDAMTREIRVPDPVFAALRPFLDDRQMVEITATVGAYNLVSRFLEALQIHDEPMS